MPENKIISQFTSTGTLLEGHFLLTSGRHSNKYFEKFNLLSQPDAVSSLCESISQEFIQKNIEVVVGAATGGIILAYEIGKQLNTKGIFSERVNGNMKFRRGFSINEGQRVVICDDLLATGGTAKAAAKLVEKIDGVVVGFAFIIELLDLNGRNKIEDYRSESLVEY